VIESPVEAIELGYPTCAGSALEAAGTASKIATAASQRPFLIGPSLIDGRRMIPPLGGAVH
jgi:hypothetical protein